MSASVIHKYRESSAAHYDKAFTECGRRVAVIQSVPVLDWDHCSCNQCWRSKKRRDRFRKSAPKSPAAETGK